MTRHDHSLPASYFDERYVSTMWGYSAPDFVRVAEAYGVAARPVGSARDLDEAIAWLWRDPIAPAGRGNVRMRRNAHLRQASVHQQRHGSQVVGRVRSRLARADIVVRPGLPVT